MYLSKEIIFELGFPMGMSRDKGTTGQAQNLATGQDGPGQPINIRYGTWYGTITIFLSRSGTGQGQDNHYFFL